jgi:pimeloyl-ACP methyl ester carboxylesterase
MRGAAPALALAALAAFGVSPSSAGFLPGPPGQVVDLPTRPGVTLRYAIFAPDRPPRAIVVMFTGGQGVAGIPDKMDETWAQNGNFLTRAREWFRRKDLYIVVLDAPSDRRSGLFEFRASPDHARDAAAVIADVRRGAPNLPVWLMGTSRGSISAAYVAVWLRNGKDVDGLVLTSSGTRNPGGRIPGNDQTTLTANLQEITVPTLVVGHRDDACFVSPFADAVVIKARLTAAPRVDIIAIEGGEPPQSDPCEALAAHGYFGVEQKAAEAIADWILAAKN